MDLKKAIISNIDKLIGELKSEEELIEVLKRKFTKKEYKVFTALEGGQSMEEVCATIKDDEKRVEDLYKNACKKLNQELVKKELIK